VFAQGKYPVKAQPEILDNLLRKIYFIYMEWEAGSLYVVNVTWTDLYTLGFILNFFNNFWIVYKL
jgi:hypothetical protein